MTDEYIPREAAKKVICDYCSCVQLCSRNDNDCWAIEALNAIPAADVVPVVRCKDCRKGIPDSGHATAYSCYGIWHKPDWFCAGGVRKAGDGE